MSDTSWPMSPHRVDAGQKARIGNTLVLAIATFLFCLGTPAAAAKDGPPESNAELRRKLLAKPGMPKIMLDSYKGTAMLTVRVERLVAIGQLCHVLPDKDASAILATARRNLDAEMIMVADADKALALVYLEGVRVGATQSASLTDAVNDDECRRFVEPSGFLAKIMTWTGRPQEIPPGVRASPMTIP